MEFLRQQAERTASNFKDLADEVWDELGDLKGVSQGYKDAGKSAGKYALTAQLLMTMNFPDNAEVFRDAFNATGKGPTGAEGFKGTPIGGLLTAVAAISQHRNASAIGTVGFSDVTQTSTINDLGKDLPVIRRMLEKGGE